MRCVSPLHDVVLQCVDVWVSVNVEPLAAVRYCISVSPRTSSDAAATGSSKVRSSTSLWRPRLKETRFGLVTSA